MSKSRSNVNKSRFNCWFLQCTFSLLATPQNHGPEEPRGVYGCTCHFWLIVDIGKIIPNAQRLSSVCRNNSTTVFSQYQTYPIKVTPWFLGKVEVLISYYVSHLHSFVDPLRCSREHPEGRLRMRPPFLTVCSGGPSRTKEPKFPVSQDGS